MPIHLPKLTDHLPKLTENQKARAIVCADVFLSAPAAVFLALITGAFPPLQLLRGTILAIAISWAATAGIKNYSGRIIGSCICGIVAWPLGAVYVSVMIWIIGGLSGALQALPIHVQRNTSRNRQIFYRAFRAFWGLFLVIPFGILNGLLLDKYEFPTVVILDMYIIGPYAYTIGPGDWLLSLYSGFIIGGLHLFQYCWREA